MKLEITGDTIELAEGSVITAKTGAVNYYELEFEFNEEWDNLTKIAVLINQDEEIGTEIPIMLNKIYIPYLSNFSAYNIGVFGYSLDGETKTLQISTNLVSFWVRQGAGSITVEEQEVPSADIWEQYIATMNGILEDTVEVKEAIEGIYTEIEGYRDGTLGYKNETLGYRDETEGYRNETEGFKNTTEQVIEEGMYGLSKLAEDFVDTTTSETTKFNNNAIEKTEAFDLNATNKTTEFNDNATSKKDSFDLNANSKTTDFNNNATEKTNIVDGIKDDVVDLKDETIGYKNEAKESADKAKVSEDNAKDSEEDAELALSDLLAMLGTSVATLTGGKLTPSQIPDLSINDVFPVADTDEMLELTAQRGDVAIIVVENVVTDTYMLSADDPTVLSNWKKLGVSYVANAGHATTADNATDSEKINGKRIVGMTETQYASAVLDEDTYYMVYPD